MNNFAIDTARQIVWGIVLNVFLLAKFAGPLAVGESTGRVRVEEAKTVKCHLLNVRFQRFVGARFVTQRQKRFFECANTEVVAHPIRGPIQSLADARAYTPPDPDHPDRLGKLPDLVRRYKGRRAILFHHRAAFMWSAYLRGIENLLMDLLAEPELAEIVLDKVLECNLRIVRRAIRAGAEVIILGDDYAGNHGPMMSPAVFASFLLPRLRKMIDMIHEEGAFCIKHSDGNLYPLLQMIVSAGPDGLNPIEPVAGMELRRVKQMIGDRICLVGNIDCAHLLPHGTAEQVREAVRTAIADAAAGGGYMLSSSNSIHSSCHAANFVAMIRAAHEFGGYA